jgi:hypothetical protein
MTVAISTSSPLVSVAVFSLEGRLLYSGRRESPRAAGAACLALLEQLGEPIPVGARFLADAGPGGFTAVKAGVVLAKTLAFAFGGQAAAASSFDLIDPSRTVAVPVQRGKYLVRVPGEEPCVAGQQELPAEAIGYGPAFAESSYPDASCASALIPAASWMPPESLVPSYVLTPSISTPNRPFRSGVICG